MSNEVHAPTLHMTSQIAQIEIRKARIETLTIFEVTEAELDALEHGAPDSVYLTFAVFLLSVAVTFTVTFSTAQVPSGKTFTCFVVTTIVGYILGILLLIIWTRKRASARAIAGAIRSRLSPEGSPQPVPEPELEIVDARYGIRGQEIDVTARISALSVAGRLEMVVWPTAFLEHDPAERMVKTLTVTYRYSGIEHTVAAKDREMLVIPQVVRLPERIVLKSGK